MIQKLSTRRDVKKSTRFENIKRELFSAPMHLCPERALLITEYFKKHDDPSEPMIIRKAKAFRHLMKNKSVKIFADELIVGNVGSQRKSALMQPELASVFMSQDLLWIDKRKTTPFQIAWSDRLKLLFRVIPYWLTRNMIVRAFRHRRSQLLRYTAEQLRATYYLINEAGGIGHFLPHYEKVLTIGIKGYIEMLEGKNDDFHRAIRIAGKGVIEFAKRCAEEASRLATQEEDEERASELMEIARICSRVPAEPAESFHEALQSLWFTHMAVCLEGLNSAVSFGRVDQYLYPFYRRDRDAGRITPEQARELLLCFSAKSTEHVFMLSKQTSEYHGGYLVAQAAIVGGIDPNGNDAVNELSSIFLDVMEESGLRDPNYQVRIHAGTSPEFLTRAADIARKGKGVPAFFNDDVSIAALLAHGYPLEEARNYGTVGCVELAIPGRSFLSTDAALFNLPLCLELALNRGRLLRGHRQIGARTPDPTTFKSMGQVVESFREQVEHMVQRLVKDIQVIERGNRDYHPTPFSSMLVDGCIESGTDITAGGARYNSSGIQGVGIADTADSLAALDEVIFRKEKYTITEIIHALRKNFTNASEIGAELLKAPKFGNDHHLPDGYAKRIVRIFHDALARHQNTRGGPYVPGFYSSTTHVGFGRYTGALPSGRRAGEPLAASLGAANGMDRLGATALLNSVAHIDATLAPNGYATNLRFDPQTLSGERGLRTLAALVQGYFESGGMEMQLNVLDPGILEDARAHPGKHPGLVVRVAGYCAYFDDLPDSVKGEIINRTRIHC